MWLDTSKRMLFLFVLFFVHIVFCEEKEGIYPDWVNIEHLFDTRSPHDFSHPVCMGEKRYVAYYKKNPNTYLT